MEKSDQLVTGVPSVRQVWSAHDDPTPNALTADTMPWECWVRTASCFFSARAPGVVFCLLGCSSQGTYCARLLFSSFFSPPLRTLHNLAAYLPLFLRLFILGPHVYRIVS
jgi:hypothetical protein